MKNYDEMANDVLRRIKEHETEQKMAKKSVVSKRKLTLIIAIFLCCCICTSVVLANQHKIFTGLSEEDKAVKAEINKHIYTEVDFRKNMQQKILGKTYDIYFVKLNKEYEPTRVIYTNDLGDDFEFDIITGYLCEAFINSNMVEESDDSIDIDTAYNIALKLLPEGISIDNYTQLEYRKSAKGYLFEYKKYIGKYRTTSSFRATIGYDGSVVDFRDSTYQYVGKNIDLDEEYVTSKIDEFAKKENAVNVKYDDAFVSIERGKVCARVYYETASGECECSMRHVMCVPLE